MYVKVCGITHLEDAVAAVAAGVDALGFNFVPASKRYVSVAQARPIIEQVRGQVLCVAVVDNAGAPVTSSGVPPTKPETV